MRTSAEAGGGRSGKTVPKKIVRKQWIKAT